MRPRACLLILLGLAAPAAAGEVPAALRAELAQAGRAFERAVARVSPPSPSLLLSGAGGSREYYLPGYGAVVVLAPRALPRNVVHLLGHPRPLQSLAATEALLERRLARARSAEEREAVAASVEQLHRARETLASSARVVVRATPPAAARAAGERPADAELRELEAQVEAFRREAERYRREAETALEIVALSAHEAESDVEDVGESQAAGHDETSRTPAQAPAPPRPEAAPRPLEPLLPPEPPPAPWAFWFEVREEPAADAAASDSAVVARTRDALVAALAAAAPVPALAADETLAVALDFHPAGPLLALRGPARTLVVRVRAGDLAARAGGRLGEEELLRRVEVSEY